MGDPDDDRVGTGQRIDPRPVVLHLGQQPADREAVVLGKVPEADRGAGRLGERVSVDLHERRAARAIFRAVERDRVADDDQRQPGGRTRARRAR